MVSEFATEKKQERAELEALEARRHKRSRIGLVVASALCAAAWLFPVSDPAPLHWTPPAGFTHASARMSLDLAARRVSDFKTANRQLPGTLAQAGVNDPAIQYSPTSDSAFTLKLTVGDSVHTWNSSAPPASFERDARTVLASTAK